MRELSGQKVLFVGDSGLQKINFVCFDDGCCGIFCDAVLHSVWQAEQVQEGLELFLRMIERHDATEVHRCQPTLPPAGLLRDVNVPA